jgi:glycosyltransferase involved in cell wall biosynthesis
LYILPSDIEGMPMSLLEAMSYGKRCLVSNIPENVEVINERCVSFEKSNPADLKEKLVSMLKEGNEPGLETAIMTWDDVADKTNDLYKGVK